MKPYPIFSFLMLIALLGTPACTSILPLESVEYQPGLVLNPEPEPANIEQQPQPETPTGEPVLLFGIGMHIEPFGSTVSDLAAGGIANKQPQSGSKNSRDYHQTPFYERHVLDIQLIADIVEDHGGVMTVQAQTPFTQVSLDSNNTILADLAANGHEIALHFHEDAHLGKNPENLSVETWCAVMKEEIEILEQASGVDQIRYWSGGNLYPDLFQAAACAGLDINSDWKNPRSQTTPIEMTGIHPWRPSGGTDGYNIQAFTQHDPNGAVVFLPEGLFDRNDFAGMRRSKGPEGEQAYFDYLEQRLLASLAAAESGQVNVFHFTIHPAEFRGDLKQPYALIERFLAEVIDPLVADGRIRWATFSEMADAYQQWESDHPLFSITNQEF